MHIHTRAHTPLGHFILANSPTGMVLGGEREPENLEETHMVNSNASHFTIAPPQYRQSAQYIYILLARKHINEALGSSE